MPGLTYNKSALYIKASEKFIFAEIGQLMTSSNRRKPLSSQWWLQFSTWYL